MWGTRERSISTLLTNKNRVMVGWCDRDATGMGGRERERGRYRRATMMEVKTPDILLNSYYMQYNTHRPRNCPRFSM